MTKVNESAQEAQSTTKLSYKQLRFVEAYLISGNATDAARRAGYSEKYLHTNASKLLRNTTIQARIEERLKESIMGANEVLKRLSDMAKSSLLPFIEITEDGFVYFDFSHPDAKNYIHLIKKIRSKRTRQIMGSGNDAEEWENEWVEVELHDAKDALVQLGRYHALFTDNIKGNVDHNVKVSVYLPDNKR